MYRRLASGIKVICASTSPQTFALFYVTHVKPLIFNLRRRRVLRETSETSRNISRGTLRSAAAVYVDIMTASS